MRIEFWKTVTDGTHIVAIDDEGNVKQIGWLWT